MISTSGMLTGGKLEIAEDRTSSGALLVLPDAGGAQPATMKSAMLRATTRTSFLEI